MLLAGRMHHLYQASTMAPSPPQKTYGFKCNCPRCAFEESIPESLSSFIGVAFAAAGMASKVWGPELYIRRVSYRCTRG